MFDLIVILILLVLAFPVIAIVALVKANGVRRLVLLLELRIRDLERVRAPGGALPSQPATAAMPAVAPATPPPPPAPAASPHPAPPASVVPPAPTPQASVPPSPPPLPPLAPAAGPGFEERFGTRWVVWVGGVALALGGIFLVRYTIEQGLIGPGVRIFSAPSGARAGAAGEWTRRRGESVGAARPAVRAHSEHPDRRRHHRGLCHGLRRPMRSTDSCRRRRPSFCWARWRLLTLAAALLHGPALAGLGVVGAYVAPMLVATDQAGLLVALYLHRRRHRGRLCAGALAAVALARDHRDRARRALDAAGRRSRRAVDSAWRARVQRARGLCARRRVPRLRPALRSAGRARRDRPALDARRCRSISWLRHSWCWRAGTIRWRSRPLSPSPPRPSPSPGAPKPRPAPCRWPRSSPWW